MVGPTQVAPNMDAVSTSSPDYLNFDLLIQREPGALWARVIASPAGEAAVAFVVPRELDNVADSGGQWSTEAIRAAGTALFEAVFAGEVLACYRSSRAVARRTRRRLRLRFRLGNARDLAWVPWEFLYDPQRGFVASFADTTVVRYLELPEVESGAEVDGPLRILVVLSNPDDAEYPRVDVERERKAVDQALASLVRRDRVFVEFIEHATLDALQARLQSGAFHVLHFVGHSGVDSTGDEGLVVLENGEGGSRRVSAGVFRGILADRDLRLVLLNSCESARSGRGGLFSGVAQGLVQAGVPAVVAMQFQVRDETAGSLVGAFYRELAQGRPVDSAVTEARKSALAFAGSGWAAPVVFLRQGDGRVIAVPPLSIWDQLRRYVPHALATASFLALLFALKLAAFYFVPWWEYLAIAVGVQGGLALLSSFLPVNWASIIPSLLSKPDGSLRPSAAVLVGLLSVASIAIGLRCQPAVSLEHRRGANIDAGGLDIPQTVAALNTDGLCPPQDEGQPVPDGGKACKQRLPRNGFLRLEYDLGISRASAYSIRINVEPAETVGLAELRTDPAFALYKNPCCATVGVEVPRARTKGNYDLYISSGKDTASLTGRVELRLFGRELYPASSSPEPAPAGDVRHH